MRLVSASALCLVLSMYAWAEPTIDQLILQTGNLGRDGDRLVFLEDLA